MSIIEFIPFGRENAIKRSDLRDLMGVTDREMRYMIADARKEVPIINLQDGNGYYRPNDPAELQYYILQEKARATKILKNINVAVAEYNRIAGQERLDV